MKIDNNKIYEKHYEENILIDASMEDIFFYADDHTNFTSHMNKSSWMMGGGSMNTEMDKDHGKRLGSHIKMYGKIFGINLFLDEVITERVPSSRKIWRTVGPLRLLVIDNYQLGFEINQVNTMSKLKVFIDYDLPKESNIYWLGLLLGQFYAKWCVRQMIGVVKNHFKLK